MAAAVASEEREGGGMSADTQQIKAIETRYAGCHFRSRLEARWAVFFDYLGIEWQYEPQGFMGAGGHYLPDFFLPGVFVGDGDYDRGLGVYVEVKGTDAALRQDGAKIVGGLIGKHGLLILGDVPPPPSDGQLVTHSFLYLDGETTFHRLAGWKGDSRYMELMGYPFSYWFGGSANRSLPESASTSARLLTFGCSFKGTTEWTRQNSNTVAAYTAARSARFEHGQSGAT